MSDLRYFDDVGEHGHMLLRDQGATNSSGSHWHVWHITQELTIGNRSVAPNGLLVTSFDGSHDHELSEDGLSMPEGGQHRHSVRLPGGKRVGTAKDGLHVHSVYVQGTGRDGSHPHVLTVGGVAMTSLMTAEFLELLLLEEAGMQIELRELDSGGLVVTKKQVDVCYHAHNELEKARECAVGHALELFTGLPVLNPVCEILGKAPTEKGLNDKLLGGLEKLAREAELH